MQRFNILLKQPELTTLNARNKEANIAQKIWEAIAPDNLAKFSHASSIKNKQLTVFAANNSVAAKIKLFIPSLLIKLEKQDCQVTAIRVKVQVKSTPTPKLVAIKKLSHNAAISLEEFVKKIPGTPLAEALSRLAKKSR
ncbi:MAG: DUF721 domain-containing protein [Methylotenera sp.]|nr:DUF721 domain-containing protein [Methylotenera sp.]